MGKRSKAKKQQNAVVEEDADEEPVGEDLDFEKEDNVDSVPWKGSEPDYTDDDSGKFDFEKEDSEVSEAWKGSEPDYTDDDSREFDFEKDDKVEPKPLVITKILLILGVLFSVVGVLGVIGLRTGIVQGLLGDPDPYPGIGSVEPMGHLAFMMPFVLGIVFLAFWSIKNDPIYNQIEEARKPQDDSDEEDELGDQEEVILDDSPEPEPEVDAVKAVPEAMPEQGGGIDGLGDLDQELAKEQELMRIQKCEKMLSAVVVLPDDKKNLKELIVQGISMEEFIEEIKKAIERRKKKELEKDVTANEKAAIIEDELVVELKELAGELEDDGSSLEDQILKELEDLEGQ